MDTQSYFESWHDAKAVNSLKKIFNPTFIGNVANNKAPTVANPISDITINEDANYKLVIPDNTFADADSGTTFTYSATLLDGSPCPRGYRLMPRQKHLPEHRKTKTLDPLP